MKRAIALLKQATKEFVNYYYFTKNSLMLQFCNVMYFAQIGGGWGGVEKRKTEWQIICKTTM